MKYHRSLISGNEGGVSAAIPFPHNSPPVEGCPQGLGGCIIRTVSVTLCQYTVLIFLIATMCEYP